MAASASSAHRARLIAPVVEACSGKRLPRRAASPMISCEGCAVTRLVPASARLGRGPTWAETGWDLEPSQLCRGSVQAVHLSPCRQTGRSRQGLTGHRKKSADFFRSTQGVHSPHSNAVSFRPATDQLAHSEPENWLPFSPETASQLTAHGVCLLLWPAWSRKGIRVRVVHNRSDPFS